MSYSVLSNVTTANDYTNVATLLCPGAARLTVDIANAAVVRQFGTGGFGGGIAWDGAEVPMTPGFKSLDRRFDAVRFKSLAAGNPAQIIAEAVPPSEIPGASEAGGGA